MVQRISTIAVAVALMATCAYAQDEPAPPASSKPPKDKAAVTELMEQLNDDDFKKRENAQIQLTKLATEHPAIAMDEVLKKYIQSSAAPEERYRLRSILYGAAHASFKEKPPGFVGIQMRSGNALNAEGVLVPAVMVMEVIPGTAAAKNGLQIADQIIGIDGREFKAPQAFDQPMNEFAEYVTGKFAGDTVVLQVVRANKPVEIRLELGKRPEALYDSRLQNHFDRQFKQWLDENTIRLGGKVEGNTETEKPVAPAPYRPSTD